jgi:predicted aspartyl protease
MWKPYLRTGTLIVLSGILALGSFACGSDTAENSSPESPVATPVPASPSPAESPSPKPTASPGNKATKTTKTQANKSLTAKEPEKPLTKSANYERAIDIAMGASNISKSAVSRDDWNLVASQWQQAISWMKAVPASSSQHATAQKKVSEYQGFLADAKLRATPPPKKTTQGDISPQFFTVPILGQRGGTPIVEVTFNGTRKFEMLFDTGATGTLITLPMAQALRLKAVGLDQVTVADGATVIVPVALLKSLEVDGRLKRDMRVWVSPGVREMGLLGQDFFEGYDISIKENVIEFRRR